MNTVDILRKVEARLVEYPEGWGRNKAWNDKHAPRCIGGHVWWASGGSVTNMASLEMREDYFQAMKEISKEVSSECEDEIAVVAWNDRHAKGVEEILEVIRKVITRLEAQVVTVSEHELATAGD